MSDLLQRGARGPEVKKLQTRVNRVGGMLDADGAFGPGTARGVKYAQALAGQEETGITDAALMNWLKAQPEPFPALNTNGVAFIAREETGGLHYYNLHAAYPSYPGVSSGITIGIGYDLRFASEHDFSATWQPLLPASTYSELLNDLGKRGNKTRARTLKRQGICIPFDAAWKAFLETTLPHYYQLTEQTFPSLPTLPDICRSLLVGLIYNRGASLSRKDRRKEMVNIHNLLASAANTSEPGRRKEILLSIEDEFISMKRLWPPGSGLVARRQREANLWREAIEQSL